MTLLPEGLSDPYEGEARRSVTLHILDSEGGRRLAKDGELPIVPVPGGARAEPDRLCRVVSDATGLRTRLLRVLDADTAELELSAPLSATSECWRWQPVPTAGQPGAPWQRPGWHQALLPRLDACLSDLGMQRAGAPVQRRTTSVTVLLEVPTISGPVWLKAAAEGFAPEGPLIRRLAELVPGLVPDCLAWCDEWWLAAPFPHKRATAPGDCLDTLAAIQRRLAGRPDALAGLGVEPRPIGELAAELACIPDDGVPAVEFLPSLDRAVEALRALGLPETIVHGDVSPNNAHPVAGGWFLYDWTDACVSHPLVDLASPLSYEANCSVARARAERFLDAWRLPPDASLRNRLYVLAQAIGSAHQTVTYDRLARRADAEAGDAAGAVQLERFRAYWRRRTAAWLAELG